MVSIERRNFPGRDSRVDFTIIDTGVGFDRVRQSITWKLTQFVMGRPLGARDARHVQTIHRAGWQKGGTYANLVMAIVMSELFQTQPSENHE